MDAFSINTNFIVEKKKNGKKSSVESDKRYGDSGRELHTRQSSLLDCSAHVSVLFKSGFKLNTRKTLKQGQR